jgi:hypothetical protein
MGEPPLTKCQIARVAATSWMSGRCTAQTLQPDIAACAAITRASRAQDLWKARYSANPFASAAKKAGRALKVANLEAMVESEGAKVQKGFGVPASVAEITWPDFEGCLWNADGSPDYQGARYMVRSGLESRANYQPDPLVGGAHLAGLFPPQVTDALVPMALDRFLNPGLALLAIGLLVAVVGLAFLGAALKPKKAAWPPAVEPESRAYLYSEA